MIDVVNNQMNVVLEAVDITSGYGMVEVLHGISLRVCRGEFVAIVGPNGCGKTTLVRVLSRVLPLWKGSICLLGRSIVNFSQKELARQMAYVPQLLETPFPYRVRDFVAMGRFPHLGVLERPRQADFFVIESAMRFFNVSHLADRNIRQLSGGERQRVLLAQGIAQEPRLFLLDEPTAHLDINYQIEVCEYLQRLSREGVTVIAIFHDLNFAAAYASRVLVLKDGRMVCSGKPSDVITQEMVRDVFGAEVYIMRSSETGHPVVIPKRA